MANVMDQLLTRFEALEQHSIAPPPPRHSNYAQTMTQDFDQNTGISVNNASVPTALPAARQPIPTAKEHPGLDHRGPNWHDYGATLACRFNPCSIVFCQGCGRHGHHSSECSRAHLPRWNHSGYFSDRYPGEGALYQSPNATRPPYIPTRFPSSTPSTQSAVPKRVAFDAAANSTGFQSQVHRPHFQPPPPFPVPFAMNPRPNPNGGGGAARPPGPSYTPVARACVAQSQSTPANNFASNSQQAEGGQ